MNSVKDTLEITFRNVVDFPSFNVQSLIITQMISIASHVGAANYCTMILQVITSSHSLFSF
jgi:hypothetical protein